jgi:hypothetical protein
MNRSFMKLITYATHNAGYYDALKVSAERNGFDLVTIGFNKKWEGFTQKFTDVRQYLSEFYDKNEVVCFIDGFDVLVLGRADELLHRYKQSFDTNKVVFTADRDSYVATKSFGPVNDRDAAFEFNRINSGCYMGRVAAIQTLFENMCAADDCTNDANDQELVTLYYKKCRDCLDIDHERELFYNLQLDINTVYWQLLIALNKQGEDPAPLNNKYHSFVDGRVMLPNGSMPVILHGNGNTNMDNFTTALDLPAGKKGEHNYFAYSTGKFFTKELDKYPSVKKGLGTFVKIFHLILTLGVWYVVLFSNNPLYLSLTIMFNVLIILQWFLFGSCTLNFVENYLNGDEKKDDNGREKSYFVESLGAYIGEKTVYYSLTFVPVFLIGVSLYKLNTLKTCRRR